MTFAFQASLPLSLPTSHRPLTTTSQQRLRMTTAAGTRRVLVPIGNGSEEIEAATVVDTLRRAGAEVTVASVESSTTVVMSRGMTFQADMPISEATAPFDAVALPGGMPGAERLAASRELAKLVESTRADGSVVAAICAAPAVVLAGMGMLEGKKATCYPAEGFRDKVPQVEEGDVVEDGKLITATGPGTALKWSLQLVEALYSKKLADKLAGDMLVQR